MTRRATHGVARPPSAALLLAACVLLSHALALGLADPAVRPGPAAPEEEGQRAEESDEVDEEEEDEPVTPAAGPASANWTPAAGPARANWSKLGLKIKAQGLTFRRKPRMRADSKRREGPRRMPRHRWALDGLPLDAPPGFPDFRVGNSSWTAQDLIVAWEKARKTFPKVRFYMYSGAKAGGVTPEMVVSAHRACAVPGYLHNGDVHFLEALIRHPWRTEDEEVADLFVAPVCLGILKYVQEDNLKMGPVPNQPACAQRLTALNKQVMRAVMAGRPFNRRKRDHLFVALDFRLRPFNLMIADMEHAPIWAHFEAWRWFARNKGGGPLVGPYDDSLPAADRPEAGPDGRPLLSMRGSLRDWTPEDDGTRNVAIFWGGDARDHLHHGYWARRAVLEDAYAIAGNASSPARDSVFVMTKGPEHIRLPSCADYDLSRAKGVACSGTFSEPTLLRRAQFLLALRGDTTSTNRVYRAVEYGAVPILTSRAAFYAALPFQCFVPYRLFSVAVNHITLYYNPPKALGRIPETHPEAWRRRARGLMRHFARDLLWRAPGSRVAENLLLEAARYRAQHKSKRHINLSVPCGFPDDLIKDLKNKHQKALRDWAVKKTSR